MSLKIAKWASRHLSFDTYMKFDPLFEKIERAKLKVQYFLFTRSKQGKSIRGTLKPSIQQIFESAAFNSLPYLLVLLVLSFCPYVFPDSFSGYLTYLGETSIFVGFMTAILAIAGVFLTLFYTSAATVLSNKYPSNTGVISDLFIRAALSNRDLIFCNAFVVVSIVLFFLLGIGITNILVIIYMAVLSIFLIIRLPKVLKLSSTTSSISSLAAIPAGRFLSLAQASSSEDPFYDSILFTANFNRMATHELALLESIMDYSINSGEFRFVYAKAVAELVAEVLVKYSRISVLIPNDSKWHLEKNEHKSWFMADSFEIDLARKTGTIPQPKNLPNPLGFHDRLWSIACKYKTMLIREERYDELSSWYSMQQAVIECCVHNDDLLWMEERVLAIASETIDQLIALPADNDEQLLEKCQLLDIGSTCFSSPVIEICKLAFSSNGSSFLFQNFKSFSCAEVYKKGFPLASDQKMVGLCAKIAYENEAYDKIITPEWCFNQSVSNFGRDSIERCMRFAQSLYSDFANKVIKLIEEDSASSFILVLREAELHRKVNNCLTVLNQFSEDYFNESSYASAFIESVESTHDVIVGQYPKIAMAFLSNESHLSEFFPDIYGFAFFNYCDQLHKLILDRKIEEFCGSVLPLFRLATLCHLDLQQQLKDEQFNERYKVQVMIEPTILFFELCGIAYCMGELIGDKAAQKKLQDQINSILDSFPSERDRWKACFDLSSDVFFHSKAFMDLFEWRKLFIDTVAEEGLYPDYPDYPFARIHWEPNSDEKRLLKMLPYGLSELREFDGCSVFQNFLFNGGETDEGE